MGTFPVAVSVSQMIMFLLSIFLSVPVLAAVKDITIPGGQPIWSIPNLELVFCPLKPKEPCPGLAVLLTVNLSEGNYSIAGGEDILCRTVLPNSGDVLSGFTTPQFSQEWHNCENPKLQWRWEFEQGKNGFWFFPQSDDGYTNIGIRLLEGPDPNELDTIDVLKATFTFRSTHISKLAGGREDAVLGCYIDPKDPIRCSFNNMLLLGYDAPNPVLLNVTQVKLRPRSLMA